MVQPINYNIDVGNPFAASLQGYQAGSAINAAQQAAQEKERQKAAQAAMQQDIAMIVNERNPTASDYGKLITKYPQFSKEFDTAWGLLNEDQKAARVNQASEVYAALEAGDTEAAQSLLETQATAARNSGNEAGAKAADTVLEMVKSHPETAKTSIGLRLAAAMGPEKFTETFTKLQADRRQSALDESQLTESQARAHKAAVEARFSESNAVTDLQKKGWDITKLQEDIGIAKENSKIAAINAQINREKNELKKQELELKLQDMQEKRDAAVRERSAAVESANGSIDNLLNTADRILNTPAGVIADATGPFESRLPTLSSDVADFESLMETLGAQSFISQIPAMKGSGALSDAEGKKLATALQSFNLKQSPQRLLSNVREAQRIMLKARKTIAQKYGVPESIPDTPAVETGADDIDALVQKYTSGGQ